MKRHPFDSYSFVAGTMFVAIGAVFLMGPDDGTFGLAWLVPTVSVGLGMACLALGIQRMRKHED